MDAIDGWWQHDVIDGHKGPLLLSLCAFVVTFLITRTITRLIRAGKGPFGNLSTGGVHLHYSTPGLIVLIVGAFTAVGAAAGSAWEYVAAVLIGAGASLVLDEFAMLFRLQDVYWSREGQLSVNMVTLTAACVGLAVTGLSPAQVPGLSQAEASTRWAVAGVLLVHLTICVVTALKGKYGTLVIGLFLAPVVWIGAVRLARPGSPWERWFYDEHRRALAARRDEEFGRRWGAVRTRWDDFLGGSPSEPDPAPDAVPGRTTDVA